jgi:hypothetical protein
MDDRHLSALLIEVGHQLAMRAWRLAGSPALDVIVLHRHLLEITVQGAVPVVPIVEHLSYGSSIGKLRGLIHDKLPRPGSA